MDNRVVRQASLSFAGLITGQLLRFVFNIVIARMLGVEYLGLYALGLSIIQIAEVIAVLGLDAASVRMLNLHAGNRVQTARIAGMALRTSFFGSLFLCAVLVGVVSWPGSPAGNAGLLGPVIISYACSLPFHVVIAVGGHVLQAFRDIAPRILAAQVMLPCFLLALTVLIYLFTGPDIALLVPMPVAAFLSALWLAWQLRLKTGIGLRDVFNSGFDTGILRYSLPLMLVSLMGMVSHWLDILMLGWYADTRTAGLYQPAVRTAGLVRSFLVAFSASAAPLIAALHARGGVRELQHLFQAVSRWIAMTAVPASVFLFMMAGDVLAIFGPEFMQSARVLMILSFALLVQASTGMCDTMLQMCGYARISAVTVFVLLCVQVVLNMWLIPLYSMEGAAYSLCFVYLLLGAARSLQLWRYERLHMFSFPLFKPFAAGICAAGVLGLASAWLADMSSMTRLAAAAAGFLGIYLAMLNLLKLEREDVEVIFELLPFLNRRNRV
ncbi:MAG: oligosaccharide flippase family protein [Prosthecochloris sp.]|nr:oligosaccharide flippase family protein [Prosthecochloris sp.]